MLHSRFSTIKFINKLLRNNNKDRGCLIGNIKKFFGTTLLLLQFPNSLFSFLIVSI